MLELRPRATASAICGGRPQTTDKGLSDNTRALRDNVSDTCRPLNDCSEAAATGGSSRLRVLARKSHGAESHSVAAEDRRSKSSTLAAKA